MAFLDESGLQRFWENIVSKFVKKVDGKDLSSNDYTNAEKQKLAELENIGWQGTGNDAVKFNTIDNIASGNNSVAEGSDTNAEGSSSHAEGYNTTASGNSSHAEGSDTTAEGSSSHAEGSNTTAKDYSHAEGSGTTASGNSSHAEGDSTTASGSNSHAEGYNTTAGGIMSHAEGSFTNASGLISHAQGYQTIAKGNYSHVEGQYNIEDTGNLYAHIAGNGSAAARSNAHTLDWEGNAWYSGDIYIGSTSGTNRDEGSKKVATEEFITNAIQSITTNEIDAIWNTTILSSNEVTV